MTQPHPLKSLSPEQEATLSELRDKINQDSSISSDLKEWASDMTLFRYLEAREWNLSKAESMLRKTLTWREKYQPGMITAADIVEQAQAGSGYVNGRDRLGRPIFWLRVRRSPPGNLAAKVRYFVFMMEELCRQMDEENGVYQLMWFMDYKDYASTMRNLEFSVVIDCMKTLQNHYPERLGRVVMYDTPWIFNVLWAVMKKVMSARTATKVSFVTGNAEKKHTAMNEFIDDTVLEAEFGGENPFVWSFDGYWQPLIDKALSERATSGSCYAEIAALELGLDIDDSVE